MIQFVIDSSAVWRLLRDDRLGRAWEGVIGAGAIGSCAPQRAEFRRSARNRTEYEQMAAMFQELYPDVQVPRSTGPWVEAAQYRLVLDGTHRSVSVVDLVICAVASLRGLVVVHDDRDLEVAARSVDHLEVRRVSDAPAP